MSFLPRQVGPRPRSRPISRRVTPAILIAIRFQRFFLVVTLISYMKQTRFSAKIVCFISHEEYEHISIYIFMHSPSR